MWFWLGAFFVSIGRYDDELYACDSYYYSNGYYNVSFRL